MENIQEKYKRIRPDIKHGDLILFHGTGVIASIIQNCDRSYWNHVGVVLRINGALFIVDANADGVQADRLSKRINKYSRGGNFCIIQSLAEDRDRVVALRKLLKRSDESWIKYDFFNGFKELLNRKFKLNLPITVNDRRDICSDYVSRYAVDTKMVTKEFEKVRIAFPADYLRYIDNHYTNLLY